jgi:hypothetical protein
MVLLVEVGVAYANSSVMKKRTVHYRKGQRARSRSERAFAAGAGQNRSRRR